MRMRMAMAKGADEVPIVPPATIRYTCGGADGVGDGSPAVRGARCALRGRHAARGISVITA